MKDLLKKYQLPKKVIVSVSKAKEGGFVVEFPDLPGCFTQVENLSELHENITDAVLTYFDVPRKETSKMVYIPEMKNTASLSSMLSPTKFDLFVAA